MRTLIQRALLTVAILCVPVAWEFGVQSAAAQDGDVMVLGPRQFETDREGGAVLCGWSIYLTTQAVTAACRLERLPVDDTIDEAIAAMDEFILANSSLHPTRKMLEEFKPRLVRSSFAPNQWEPGADGLPQFCSSGRELVDHMRAQPAQPLADAVAKLLAVPREPVMNPCL